VAAILYWIGGRGLPWGRRLFVLAALGAIAAEGLLIYLLLAERYDVAYVWQFSERAIPWYFKVSGAWAGQEGSLLLWTALTALLGLFAIRRLGRLERPFMGAYSLILAALIGIVAFALPFAYHKGANAQGFLTDPATGQLFTPHDGAGLNPVLENFWMTIHPPVMFLGFASLAILFCFAVAAMITRDDRTWSALARPWAAFSVASTGLGMCLGGFWAYETLGWGGFWAWDPVENISLIPFLGVVALAHGLYVYNATGRMARANLFLAAFPFITFLFGTFLTRSGTLAEVSVHSFGGMGLETKHLLIALIEVCLVGFAVLFTWSAFAEATRDPSRRRRFVRLYAALVAAGAVMLAWALSLPGSFTAYLRWPLAAWGVAMLALLVPAATLPAPTSPVEPPHPPREDVSPVTRRQGMYLGIGVVVVIALLTLAGTAWPWLTFLARGRSTALEPEFYNRALAIPGAALLLLAALVPFLGWHETEARRFLNRLAFPWTAAVGLAVAGFFGLGLRTPLALAFAALCFLTVAASLWRIIELVRRSRVTIGGFLSHTGVAVLLLGMIASTSFEREAHGVLDGGKPATLMGYTVTRGDDRVPEASTETKFIRRLALRFRAGSREFVARPECWERWVPGNYEEPLRMTRPWIKRGVDADIYVAVGSPVWMSDPLTLAPGQVGRLGDLIVERLTPLEADGPVDKPGTAVTTKFRITLAGRSAEVAPGWVRREMGFERLRAPIRNGEEAVVTNVRDIDGAADFHIIYAQEQLPVTIYYKPLTILVWIGAGIMTLGALVSMWRRTLDSRALARKATTAGES
jgi:cytochrome c-type biogenesis protein CcmF